MEIRSLMAAMNQDGTFSTRWIASYKEHEYTEDEELQQHRDILAMSDMMAGKGHAANMEGSYGKWLEPDEWQL